MVRAERAVRTKGSDQRDRVLAAAIDAIAERGPHRVTVRDIAARAGISPSHVLYYFGRRENILIETLRWSEAELAQERASAIAAVATSSERVRIFVGLYLPADARDVQWNLWNQVIAAPPRSPETEALVAELEQDWVDDLAAILADGITAGDFPAQDVAHLALTARFVMDGVASDIVLGLPDRSAQWGVNYVCDWLSRQLAVNDH